MFLKKFLERDEIFLFLSIGKCKYDQIHTLKISNKITTCNMYRIQDFVCYFVILHCLKISA